MNEQQVAQVRSGLYLVHWYDDPDRPSRAAVGVGSDGRRWLAPINWVAPSSTPGAWAEVEHLETLAEAQTTMFNDED
jgi:hypothetical protein